MALDWERWEAMRASLDYCCVRIGELEQAGGESRGELEELVEYGMTTAARLLSLPEAPPLSTARFRAQWHDGCAAVHKTRERIARAGRTDGDLGELLDATTEQN